MSKVRIVARNSLWSALDLLVDVVMPPVISVLMARQIGPSKLGTFIYVGWLSTAAITFAGFGVHNAARKYLADYAGQLQPALFRAIYRRALVFQALSSLALALLGIAWVNWALPADQRLFASMIMLAVFPQGSLAVASAINDSVEDLRPNVIASVTGGLVFALGVTATLVQGWDLVGLAGSQLSARAVDCSLRWFLTLRRLPSYLAAMGENSAAPRKSVPLPDGVARKIVKFCAESSLLALLTLVVANRSEMFFLKRYCDIRQVAFYSIAFGLSMVASQVVGPFSRAAGASLFAERGRREESGRYLAQVYFRYLALLALPASFGLAALSAPLVHLLYGPKYTAAAPVLAIAAAFGVLLPLAAPATALATSAGGQNLLVRCGVIATLVTLACDYWMVRAHAAVGGAVANGLGQAVSTGAVWFVAYRYFGLRIPLGFASRVLLSAAGMATIVVAFVHFAPDLASVLAGPGIGALSYFGLLKLTRVVEAEDVQRLLKIEGLLPSRARPPFRRLLNALAHRTVQAIPAGQ